MQHTHNIQPNTSHWWLIVAVSLLTALILLLQSCSPEKRLARKQAKYCNDVVKVDSVTSIQTDTIIKETTRTVKLAPNPDTLLLFAQAYCDSNNKVQLPLVVYQDKFNKAGISIKDNKVNLRVICGLDSIKKVILEKDTYIKYLKKHKEVRTVLRYKVVDKWYKWFFWITIFVFVLSVAAWMTWRHFIGNKLDLINKIKGRL